MVIVNLSSGVWCVWWHRTTTEPGTGTGTGTGLPAGSSSASEEVLTEERQKKENPGGKGERSPLILLRWSFGFQLLVIKRLVKM